MASDKIITITDNWQSDVLDSELPVLVDFWAEWCGPCRAIGPILDELAEELDGKLKIAKVNVDQNQPLAGQYNVRSIPNLLLLVKGQVTEQMVGMVPKQQLRAKIDPHLG